MPRSSPWVDARRLLPAMLALATACHRGHGDPAAADGDGDGSASGSGGSSGAAEGGDDGDAPPVASSAAVRRLSIAELGNSYRDVLGVVPPSLGDLPPDSLGETFDRIVNAQTVSAAHLEGFAAVAREAATMLVASKTLDDRVPECADAILPPLAPPQLAEIPGTGLAAGPDWALQPTDVPDALFLQYATEATLSYGHLFPAPGTYVVGLNIDVVDGAGSELRVMFNGAPVQTFTSYGGAPYEVTIEVEAEGTGVIDYELDGTGNFSLLVRGMTVDGPADPASSESAARRACITAVVDRLAPLAFRRPLAPERREQLIALVDAAEGDWGEALKMVFEAIFANPSFLYLVEVGTQEPDAPGLFALDAWERASRLSYALCESSPDAELRAAAAADALSDAELEAHVVRLLDSPCGEATVQRFVAQLLWLNRLGDLDRDPTLFADWNDDVAAGMASETQRFVRELVFAQKADLRTLFSADYSWPDPRSAFLYGIATPSTTEQTTLPPERAGILTQPSVLAVTSTFDTTTPVRRGVFVLEQVLCQELPPPPPGQMISPPPPDPSATTRERWEQHSADPTCAGCHKIIDPIGFTFEEFDAIGRYRTSENGKPIDPTGGAPAIGADDGTLAGAAELARLVAESPEAVACFSKQWLRFSLGRLETEADADSLATVEAALAEGSIHDALVSITATSAFTHRQQQP